MTFVSEEDWLMFANKEVLNKDDGTNSPMPNVYLDFGRGRQPEGTCNIGLTFNNVKAVDRLKNILTDVHKEEKNEIVKKLFNLNKDWILTISRKIKDKNHAQTPVYKRVYEKISNQIDNKIIDDIIHISNHIREEGRERRILAKIEGKYYMETPEINLMQSTFKINEDEYRQRIKEVFEVLEICLKIKPDSEIKRIEKEEELKMREKLREIENKIRVFDYDKKIGIWNKLKEEQYESLVQDRNKLKKELDSI
jgi:hypothetical protein